MKRLNHNIKEQIFQKAMEEAQNAFLLAKDSYASAIEHSRSDDMKSEGKYDTRAIEAGYLASAKKSRMEELKRHMIALEKLDISEKRAISVGSLVRFDQEGKERLVFVTPGTSAKIQIKNLTVQALSVDSPLIREAIGLELGETLSLETPQGESEYEVSEIL